MKKSLHVEYVHYHPIKSFQSVKIQKQTRWSVKNWRDLPTVSTTQLTAGLDETFFIVGQISLLEKQYRGYISQKKNMIYFSAFDDQTSVRK